MTNKKTFDALGKFLIFFRTNYKTFNSKIHLHLHVKVVFGKKDFQSFFKVIRLAPSYMF
jgi:hypothetical protein